jgi:hypothetical protein
MIRPLHSLAAFALALTLAILGPLAFGAPSASADTATTVRIDPGLLDENGTGIGSGSGLTTVGADPDQPIALIVWLSGPPLWDLYKAARDQAGAKDSDMVVPVSTLETWNTAIAARQVPAERAIEALGADVISRYRAVANGLLVLATRDQIPDLMAVPGAVAITAAPTVTLDLGNSVPHIGAKRVQDELKFDGTGVVAAIIDTGMDYIHADFEGVGTSEAFAANDPNFVEEGTFPTAKVVGGVDLAGSTYAAGCPPVPGYTCTLEPEPDDDPLDEMYVDGFGGQGHGTHVGGITAGEGTVDPTTGDTVVPEGVAPGARVVAVKIFGNPRGPLPAGVGGGGGTNLVADGLEWVMLHNLGMDVQGWPAEDASGNRMQINVINMSVGGPWGTGMAEYNDIIDRLVDSGVTTVMSAGNNGNIPYITGAPAAAEMAISVASSFANGQTGVLFTANWEDQTLESLGTEASDVLAPQFQNLPPYENLPLAWYGLACNNPDGTPSTPAQDVSEKVALIERGTCIFTEKLLNAQKMGAVAVVVFSDARPPVVMGGDCWPKLTCVDRPAIMIDNGDGMQLKTLLEGGTEVKASFPLTPREELTNTISDFSSRGPARFTAGVKPQITAPGSAINSARSGTGYGAVHQGGTSMSGPTVAGVAALLWQRNMEEDLKLTGAEVGALMLNYSRTEIHTELDNNGPLVGISRQGAGLVNAFTSATAKTVVRSDRGIAELGFGDVYASNEPATYVKMLTVKNFGSAAKTYKASASYIFPEYEGAGITFSFEPESLTVAEGDTETIEVTMHVDPAKLANWTLPGPSRIAAITNPQNFQDAQIEGTVHLTEVNASGQPVAGGDLIGVPYSSMPHRSSCTVTTTTDPINLKKASTEQKVANNCAQPGAVATYMRLGEDPAEPGYPDKLNIENVGVRWFEAPTRDPNFPDVPLQVIELAIHTSGTRRIPLDTAFRVYFDTNRDGQFDKVGWNLANGLQWITLLGRPFPGTLNPDISTAVDATGNAYVNLQPYNIEETTTVLRFFANHPNFGVGFDMTKGDAMFDFAVSVADQTEDFAVTDTFLGYDLAPDNLEDGVEPGVHADAAYRFDQKLVDCAKLTNSAGNTVSGNPELVSVAPNGGQVTFNVQGCTAYASQANAAGMALMMHYPWNMPGENVEFRSIGQPMIYLPLAQKEFEVYPPQPTVEIPTPEAPPTAVR